MTHRNCGRGPVQPSVDDRWGFNVTNENNKPLVWLTYQTKDEANVARDLIAEVLKGAAVTPLAQ